MKFIRYFTIAIMCAQILGTTHVAITNDKVEIRNISIVNMLIHLTMLYYVLNV